MKTCLALFCALTLLASPFLFAYVEAMRLLHGQEAAGLGSDIWLPLVVVLFVPFGTSILLWIVGSFNDSGHHSS